MGYQSRGRSSRSSGRGGAKTSHEKAKSKGRKHRPNDSSLLEENEVPTLDNIVERTTARLRTLSTQRFATSPFREHFDSWNSSLKSVLTEFQSNPNVTLDDQFEKEYSQILSTLEQRLEENRQYEISLENTIKSLSDNKILLEQIEKEYTAQLRKFETRKNSEIKHLSRIVDSLNDELREIRQTKTGFFKGVSKKAKMKKEAEATQKLNSKQKELEMTAQEFNAEQHKLSTEYETNKQSMIEQMHAQQKIVDTQEIDNSMEARRKACEALSNSINSLLQRKATSVK